MSDPHHNAVRLTRVLSAVFFRSVEVVGAEKIPASGALLYVANHGNSLVDPMLLLAQLPRPARFLAKHTLWSNPAVRPLLELAGAIPVYRRQDGAEGGDNDATFAACFAALGAGGAIALFPEGISYHAPKLQPLKTGAARIALGAERTHGPLGLRIVPVGLTFEDKAEFRSRALIVVGDPLDPAPELALAASDERARASSDDRAHPPGAAHGDAQLRQLRGVARGGARRGRLRRGSPADARPPRPRRPLPAAAGLR